MSKLAESHSKAFYALKSNNIPEVSVIVCKDSRSHGPFPVAEIMLDTGIVVGMQGNTGNRFDRLSDIEKMDIGTLANALVDMGIVSRLPSNAEQFGQ